MDIEKLIEQLSARGLSNGSSLGYHSGLFDEAAAALSTLQAENEKLRARVNDLETQHRTELCGSGYDCVELGKLRAELERVKRCIEIVENQMDAAIYDMTALMAGQCCDLCAVEYCSDRSKTVMCTAFKWRGPQKED